jgi:two-component system, OmpR family, sensor histidine kinase TctE
VFLNYRVAMLIVGSASDQRLADEARVIAQRINATDGRLQAERASASAPAAAPAAAPASSSVPTPAAAPALGSAPAPSLASAASISPSPDVMTYSVRDAQGRLLAGSPRVVAAPSSGTNPSFADGELGGDAVRIATYRVPTSLGAVTVNVAEPSARRAVSGHFIITSTWLMDFIQVDVTLLLVWLAVHYGLKPLMAVRRQIEMRSVRELQPLEISSVPSEVRPLASTLNLLFDMLREAARSQRRFVADTAHQLRTPIAGLMAHLELLMHEPAAAPVRGRLEMLHEGMSRLSHSANQLLALARAEPSVSVAERFEGVALESLVRRVVELNVNRAMASGHDLGAELQPAEVSGNPRLLDDLLGNLVDNALDYTPAGGHITVRCGVATGRPFLEIEDDGPGIPEAERARVRQRFYRIPGTTGRGCGLGLAIVDEIARLHDAAVTLDAGARGRGTRVRVEFPAVLSEHESAAAA